MTYHEISDFINLREPIVTKINDIKYKLERLKTSSGLDVHIYTVHGDSKIYESENAYSKKAMFSEFESNIDRLCKCDSQILAAIIDYYKQYLDIFENKLKELNTQFNIED